MMDSAQAIDTIAAALREEDAVDALFLGGSFATGTQDYASAARWFQKAAEQGIKIMMYNSGMDVKGDISGINYFGSDEFVAGEAGGRYMAEQGAHCPSRGLDRSLAEACLGEAVRIEPGAMGAGQTSVVIGDGSDHRRPGLRQRCPGVSEIRLRKERSADNLLSDDWRRTH